MENTTINNLKKDEEFRKKKKEIENAEKKRIRKIKKKFEILIINLV